MAAKSFGGLFKSHRIASGKTLRVFCQENGFDPGNISKLERGRFAPPQSDEKLAEYARALGLKKGSEQWIEFFDRAAAEAGRVPSDILSDEELVKKLPLVFRTVRGARIGKRKLGKLAERIRDPSRKPPLAAISAFGSRRSQQAMKGEPEEPPVPVDKVRLPKRRIGAFCRRWRVRRFSVFGSALRSDFGPDSDVDVLLDFEESARWGMFDMVRMQEELEALFGRDVDILTRRGVEASRNRRRREAILSSAETVYGA